MTRHKAIKASLSVGSSSEWNDDHISDFTDEIMFNEDMRLTDYNLTQTDGGSNPAMSLTDSHMFVKFETGATTGKISSARKMLGASAGNITNAKDSPIMNIAIWLDSYHTAGEVFEFGLIDYASADAFTANQAGAYFRIKDEKIYMVTGTGAAETATDITPITGIPEYGSYRIMLSETICYFYIDNMLTYAGGQILTLPTTDLTMKVSAQSQNNVNSICYVDGIALQRRRYLG